MVKVNVDVAVLTMQLRLTWQKQKAARPVARVEVHGRHGKNFRRRVKAPMGSIPVGLSKSLDSSPFDVGGDLRREP